jgi:putative two-component system response regulator
MKTHASAGVQVINQIGAKIDENDFLNQARKIAGAHHEKWDGSGYPLGLKGEEIPLVGRMMAIADVFDALVSVRPYKPAMSPEEARKIIVESSGTHFDPRLVDVFEKSFQAFAEISRES